VPDSLLDELRSLPPTTRERPVDQLAPWREELAGYVAEMKNLRRMQPDDAMSWLSSVSARILEMMLVTLQSESRAATKFRVEALIPARDETRFQYQVASRRHSVSEFDWSVAGGQAT
jgi:hypothetical protein